jgi:hypothetical protein
VGSAETTGAVGDSGQRNQRKGGADRLRFGGDLRGARWRVVMTLGVRAKMHQVGLGPIKPMGQHCSAEPAQ